MTAGIDYTHPALNGGKPAGVACYGKPECQVIGGNNFADDGSDDPFDNCNGHGTHVSSIAAARASSSNSFTGVAPEAKLRVYKVLSCDGDVSNDVLIKALTTAFSDGVDVINMSLGGAEGWPRDPASLVVTRMIAKGVAISISTGNDGQHGAAYASNPASAENATRVGSVENVELITYSGFAENTSDGEKPISLLSALPFDVPEGKLPVKIIDPSLTTTTDGCDPAAVAAAGPFNNTVVVVGRGGCKFTTKFTNIFNNGGSYALVYGKPLPAGITYTVSEVKGLKAATLLRDEGLYIKQQVVAGNAVTIDFTRQVLAIEADDANGGRMSDFSTLTPSWDLQVPTVAGVGGNILGAWPVGESSSSTALDLR